MDGEELQLTGRGRATIFGVEDLDWPTSYTGLAKLDRGPARTEIQKTTGLEQRDTYNGQRMISTIFNGFVVMCNFRRQEQGPL